MAADPLDQLTPRQRDIYEFIRERIAEGRAPTWRDIGAHFGISSPNGVSCNLKAIQRKGFIEYDPGKTRSIRLPDAVHVTLSGTLADRVRVEAERDGVAPSAWVEALVTAHLINQPTD